jgi:hypothetical protein
MLEVGEKEMEGRDDTAKKERKSFVYCGIEESEKSQSPHPETRRAAAPKIVSAPPAGQ